MIAQCVPRVTSLEPWRVDWTGFTIDGNHKCLKYIGKNQLQNAKSVCAKVGAKVPLPRNANEGKGYQAAFNSLGASGHVALGLNDVASEGTWRDDNANILSYANWIPGQPGGGSGQNHACMENSSTNAGWRDLDATTTVSIICEL